MKVLHYIAITVAVALGLHSCKTSEDNLSGTKVYIAQRLQTVLLNEYLRGQEKQADLKEYAEDKSQPDLQKKAKEIYTSVIGIDEDLSLVIQFLENEKLRMFNAMGQPKSILIKNKILIRPYSLKDPIYPADYDLNQIQFTGTSDILDPEGDFRKEFVPILEMYRRSICERIANSELIEKGMTPYFFKDPLVREYGSLQDLEQQINKAIESSNVAFDDREALKKIYMLLSHNSKSWDQLFIDNIRWADAFTILEQLELDALQARADAISLIRSRIGCGGSYRFDKIIPIAIGPETARQGEDVYIDIFVAAYDSYEVPEVMSKDGEVIAIKDGKARLKVKVGKPGKTTLKGTITIRNKSGVPKTQHWSKTIVVLQKE